MNYSSVLTLLVASSLGVLVSACDGDDSGNSQNAGPSSSVASDKELSALSADEVAQLNEEMDNYAAQQMASVDQGTACRFAGTMMAVTSAMMGDETPTDASLQEICSSTESTCMQGSSTGSSEVPDETSEAELEPGVLSGCTATVAEYQACTKDSTNAVLNTMKGVPKCSELKAATLESTMASLASTSSATQTASCTTMYSKCPGLTPDDTL